MSSRFVKNIVTFAVIARLFLSAPTAANASGATGQIVSIIILGTNFAMVTITNPTGTSTCTSPAGQYAFDISTAKGKALLSVIEGAQLAGKTVGAGGEACLTVLTGTTAEGLGILTVFTN
jgi:hypothetical protein